MKVIYIADDGKEFDDEWDCRDYEWKLNHSSLKDICFYDKDDKLLEDIFSEKTYNVTDKIVVTNENQLKDLQELARYCGFCCYEDIVECGEWIFDYYKGTFVKS